MVLSVASVEWAIQSVADHSDGDLFPRVAEMTAIVARKTDLAAEIVKKPLTTMAPGAARRFIVPKDELSYRQATQLHPQDTIILSAIVFQYGGLIEARRAPPTTVFSYRHRPTIQYGLYDSQAAWIDFWTTAEEKAQLSQCILYCDISDFYNQVAHHTVENQLIAAGLPNQITKWIIALLESTTAGVSRGVPIGPHAAHIIAEASLIPIDNSMSTSGLDFIRYADDILIFYCGQMRDDRPINASEEQLLGVVKKYSGGSPYIAISFDTIDPDDWSKISRTMIEDIIDEYIKCDEVGFI
jgi:hypothetical protein